jgi:RNA polymerase sigma factor (TIGR02999 family)
MPSHNTLYGMTEIIAKARDGAPGAKDDLFCLALSELRQIAQRQLKLIPKAADLDVTGLVNEAWLKMERAGHGDFQNRSHFFAIAGRAIRDSAVDEARRCLSQKAGGSLRVLNLDEALPGPLEEPAEFLELDAALARLGEVDASAAELIEQWIFVGMSHEEIAYTRGVSLSSVRREWRFARAFLSKQLEQASSDLS